MLRGERDEPYYYAVMASRAFDAADLDGSARLNRHEFALLRRALITYDPARDAAEPLIAELRKRYQDRMDATSGGSRLVLDPRAVEASVAPAGPVVGSAMVGANAVNAGLVLDEALRAPADADWRGTLAAPRHSERFAIAMQVVEAGHRLSSQVKGEPDVSDSAWLRGGAALAQLLGTPDATEQARRLGRLAAETRRIAAAQPTVVRVPAPAKLFGDVHGQLRDLLLLLAHHGYPSHRGGDVETTAYVFNGDWVDRGAHQLEVVALLFALKVAYPARVFLVRGNHEFRSQSFGMKEHGFAAHVHHRYSAALGAAAAEGLHEEVHKAFEWLPLAAVVGNAVLVLHGGIGDGSWGVRELAAVPRPLREAVDADVCVPPCVLQALWSDPSDSDAEMAWGVHGGRGVGIPTFGPDVTAAFCQREGLQLVVRSHQYVREGVKFMHGGHLATLFSARNYIERATNDSALLLVAADEQGALRVRAKKLAHRVRAAAQQAPIRRSLGGAQ